MWVKKRAHPDFLLQQKPGKSVTWEVGGSDIYFPMVSTFENSQNVKLKGNRRAEG